MKGSSKFTNVPLMPAGKYKGVPVDKLPLSYCRWMLTQKFSPDIVKIARAKVEASPLKKKEIAVSVHAIDKFSLLYHDRWLSEGKPNNIGLGEYVIQLGTQALMLGKKLSTVGRPDDTNKRYEFDGVVYVFGFNDGTPDYKELVTLFPAKKLSTP